MSIEGARLKMTQLVTVQRNSSETASDSWDAPLAPDWEPVGDPIPCRMWVSTGRQAVEPTAILVADDIRLIVQVGTDVTEKDRLSDITDRGAVVLAGPISIQAILVRPDHLELVLQRIT